MIQWLLLALTHYEQFWHSSPRNLSFLSQDLGTVIRLKEKEINHATVKPAGCFRSTQLQILLYKKHFPQQLQVLRMLWSNRIHTDSKYFFHKYTANRVQNGMGIKVTQHRTSRQKSRRAAVHGTQDFIFLQTFVRFSFGTFNKVCKLIKIMVDKCFQQRHKSFFFGRTVKTEHLGRVEEQDRNIKGKEFLSSLSYPRSKRKQHAGQTGRCSLSKHVSQVTLLFYLSPFTYLFLEQREILSSHNQWGKERKWKREAEYPIQRTSQSCWSAILRALFE